MTDRVRELSDFVREHDAMIVVGHVKGEFLAEMTWSHEAPDSPIAGVAVQALGLSLVDVLTELADQATA